MCLGGAQSFIMWFDVFFAGAISYNSLWQIMVMLAMHTHQIVVGGIGIVFRKWFGHTKGNAVGKDGQ